MEKALKVKLAHRPKRPYVFSETHPEEMGKDKPSKEKLNFVNKIEKD